MDRPSGKQWLHAAGAAAILLALYAASAPRTVAMEDDGLFVMSSYFLGMEHPPGYPLHTLLGKLFTLLPLGSVAYRVHLLSAVFGALAAGALWMCAWQLTGRQSIAWLAALGLGLSRTFWSQAIIAEVYTLNAFFVFALVFLALRASSGAADEGKALLLMAPVFGLSLANHWPLMLLAAPALAVLLWPRRWDILQRLPLLGTLLLLGLAPYAWMVVRSWSNPAVSFYGPIESLHELWVVLSRAGYASADSSPAATWADRARYFGFLGEALLLQFAVVGTLLAAVGWWVQWREWGTRVAAALTLVFLAPTLILLLLLGFDYDHLRRHVYEVYPLPAYGMMALWMVLGFARIARGTTARVERAAAATLLLALIAALGWNANLRAGYDWTARYARALLGSLPANAVLFLHGDAQVGVIGYFHLIEGVRPDVTLYNTGGLVFGNRLFHPLRIDRAGGQAAVRAFVEREPRPVAFTGGFPEGHARDDRWLFTFAGRSAGAHDASFQLDEPLRRFLEESVLSREQTDPWTRFVQGELRRRMGALLCSTLRPDRSVHPAVQRYLAQLEADFDGALGMAEGLLANDAGHSMEQVARLLDRARVLMPDDARKSQKAAWFELNAYLRLDRGDVPGATSDLEAAVALQPYAASRAAAALMGLYQRANDTQALARLQERLVR
jgi:4-amino-4-deoxy-L-arabinose transferase-like glycosyltransferase